VAPLETRQTAVDKQLGHLHFNRFMNFDCAALECVWQVIASDSLKEFQSAPCTGQKKASNSPACSPRQTERIGS
jgi:hypothetical protein